MMMIDQIRKCIFVAISQGGDERVIVGEVWLSGQRSDCVVILVNTQALLA